MVNGKRTKPTAVLIYVPDWEMGFSWYQKGFPSAVVVQMPDYDFRALRIGDFLLRLFLPTTRFKADFGF